MIRKRLLITLLVFLGCFYEGRAQNWDVDITKSINPQNPNSDYWKATSSSAYFFSAAVPVSLLVVGWIEKDPGLKRKSYEIFGSIAISIVITEALKYSINRPRPGDAYPNEIFPFKEVHDRSFPSGHTSLAFSTAASLSIQYKKWYVVLPAYLWAGSVGYSRMYLGVHYFTDVMAGAAIGVGSAYLSHWLFKKYFYKKEPHKKTID
jgi:membrane-associated phospholipid phosphatase